MATTVEQILNQALRAIGYDTYIGSVWDGSRASRAGLELYGQARDELLRMKDWPFARQTVSLGTPTKTAPVGGYASAGWSNAYPPLPWIYEYSYPPACIYVRSVRPVPSIIPEFFPRPYVFAVVSDNATGLKSLVTNLRNAQANITAQITNPAQFEPGFTSALVAALALQLQKALDPKEPDVKDRAAEAAVDEQMADARRG